MMKTERALFQLLHDFLGLFYPNLCLACGRNLPSQEELICVSCEFRLPETRFHQHRENPFTERFWGRIPLESGAAQYHFVKGGKVQRLIHRLKYDQKQEIGIYLGRRYGRQLLESPWFADIDLIVPIPLHPRKEHQRGYNQSALFARGLSEGMGKPWLANALQRYYFTETQTRKSRMERFGNVEEAFLIGRPETIRGRHILLVDDVITTGATLEACGGKILEIPGTRLSMATIAFAE